MRTAPFFLLPILAGVAVIVLKKPAEKTTSLFRIEENYKIGYIDEEGKMIIPARYFNGSDFSEGLAAVRQNGFYGYIDPKGDFAIAPQFDWGDPFSEGLAMVGKDGHFYYIDHNGQPAFPCNYKDLSPFKHGVAVVETFSGHRGLIDKQGRLVLDTLYGVLTDFDEGLSYVDINRKNRPAKEGVIDTLGHFVIPLGKYTSVGYPHHGYCIVEDNSDNQIVLDRSGKIVFTRPEHRGRTAIGEDGFSEDIASLIFPNHEGFIDIHKNVLLDDTTVTETRSFSCGRAFIKYHSGNYRLIDRQMHMVGKDEYQFITGPGFMHGYAIVTNADGSNNIIDTSGRVIFTATQMHQLAFLDDHHFVDIFDNGRTAAYDIVDINSRTIIKANLKSFDRAGFVNGLLKIVSDDNLAIMDTLGKTIWHDNSPSHPPLTALNTDYMMRGYFYAYSSPGKDGQQSPSGGWAVSRNIPKKIGNKTFGSDALRLIIDTTAIDTFSSTFRGYSVYLANTTGDTCWFNAEDSRLYLKTQVQNQDGEWKDIDYQPGSWCGNSYHNIALEPNTFWKFIMPKFDGAIPVKLRLQLEFTDKQHPDSTKTLYSNTISSAINPAQYWNKRPYYPRNIMDPYFD